MADPDKLDDLADLEEEDDLDDVGGDSGGPAKSGFKGFSSNIIKILVIVIALVLVVVITILVSYFVSTRLTQQPQQLSNADALEAPPEPGKTLSLDEFTTNTADVDETHIVRVDVVLSYDRNNVELDQELNSRIPQLRDIIESLLASKYYRDLKGQGRNDLKKEIKASINMVLIDGKINDVFLNGFIAQ